MSLVWVWLLNKIISLHPIVRIDKTGYSKFEHRIVLKYIRCTMYIIKQAGSLGQHMENALNLLALTIFQMKKWKMQIEKISRDRFGRGVLFRQ